MPGTLHSKRKALEIAERRGRVRALVTPPIYVNLDNLNGGLVFNISEDGLALTAALDLAGSGFLTVRILLPDSEGWIETSGEIAWRGTSKKDGGVRFVGLAEDACRRIGKWIAAEASHREFQVKKDASAGLAGLVEDARQRIENWSASETSRGGFHVAKETNPQLPGQRENASQRLRNWIFQEGSRTEFGLAKDEPPEEEKHIVDIASVRATSSSMLKSVNPALIVEKEEQCAIVPPNSDTRLDVIKMGLAKPHPRHALLMPDKLRDARVALGLADRRAQARTPITPPVYANLENANGGLAFNMSQDGVALTAALALAGDNAISMKIHMPDSKGWMELCGQLAWRSESGKTAGIAFVGLTEDSRQRIREWLAAETSEGELRSREGMLPKSEQHSSDDAPLETPMAPLPALLNANAIVEKRMLEAILSADPLASLGVRARVPISRQKQRRELQEQITKLPDGPAEHLEIQENPKLEISTSEEALSVSAVQEDWQASVPSHFAVPGIHVDKVPAAPDALDALRPPFSKRSEFKPRSRPALYPTTSGTRTEKLRRLAAAVTLAGATAALIGWVRGRPAVRNEMTTFILQNTKGASKSAELKTFRLANQTTNDPALRTENSRSPTHEFEPVPANGRATDSETRAPARPQVRDIKRLAARSTVNGVVRRTESSLVKSQPARLPEQTVVAAPIPAIENARNQVAKSLPHSMENSPTPATSPSASVASGTALAEVKERESPPPLVEQPAAAAPTWSVSVSADPYPSIRMPQKISSQKKASSTKSLQIGRVISRVEPVYPEDAKHQGVEGIVKLHVVVGRDGSVQSVEPISGLTLLAKAAMSAVREWRYAQTLLGGQPVETEQDIMVRFRLAVPSISKN